MQLLHHSVHSVVPSVRVSVATCMTSHTGAAPQRALELEQQSGCLGNTCKCRARLHHQAGLAPTRHLPTRWNTRGMAVRTYTCPRYVLFKLELRVGLLEAACIRPTCRLRNAVPRPPSLYADRKAGTVRQSTCLWRTWHIFREICTDATALQLPSIWTSGGRGRHI